MTGCEDERRAIQQEMDTLIPKRVQNLRLPLHRHLKRITCKDCDLLATDRILPLLLA